MRIQKESVSMEAIAHQGHSKLYAELIDLCDKLKYNLSIKGNNNLSALDQDIYAISEAIKKHTNIQVLFTLVKNPLSNAVIQIQGFGLNHIFAQWAVEAFSAPEGSDNHASHEVKYLVKKAKEPVGWVNRQNSKVHGIFKEFKYRGWITTGQVSGSEAESVASVILHELGHIFTQLEFLTAAVMPNYALASIAQVIMGTENIAERVELIHDVKKDLELEYLDASDASTAKNGVVLSTLFLNASLKKFYSVSGNYAYDYISCEYLADQFSVRHGAGVALAKDMHAGFITDISRQTRFSLIMFDIRTIIGTMLTLGLPVVIGAILMALTPDVNTYDKPKDRLKRIKAQILDALKNESLATDLKKKYIEDAKEIDSYLKLYNDYEDILVRFLLYVIPNRRKAKDNKAFQQVIEDLAYPRLLTTAAEYELRG